MFLTLEVNLKQFLTSFQVARILQWPDLIFPHKMLKYLILIISVLPLIVNSGFLSDLFEEHQEEYEVGHSRSPKWLPFLAVVKFNATACSTKNGDGVCLPHKTCMNKIDAYPLDVCAQGYGTCCLILKSCEENSGVIDIKDNQTLIVQPNRTQSCQFSIPKPRDVCQIRLDFIEAYIGDAELGNCPRSYISISGSTTVDPNFKVCGNLTGQHMYLAYGEESEKITLRIVLERIQNYRIRVGQILCDAERKVPEYCLQYYPNITGNIQSFNYPNQLNSQKYSICIDPTGSTHSLKLQKRDFFVSGHPVSNMDNMEVSSNTCDQTNDFIQVFGDKRPFCYRDFPQTLMVKSKPYIIYVNFDEFEAPVPPNLMIPMLNSQTCVGANLLWDCNNNIPDCNMDGNGCCCVINVPSDSYVGSSDVGNTGFSIDYEAF